MRKWLLSGILALVLISAVVSAQAVPKVKTLVVLGKGIAVSPSDPLDFNIAKLGIGVIKVNLFDNETEEVTLGVLILDDEKYKLKDITKDEDGSVSGDVYSSNEKIGSFSLSSVVKDDTEIWAGTLEINDETKYL